MTMISKKKFIDFIFIFLSDWKIVNRKKSTNKRFSLSAILYFF